MSRHSWLMLICLVALLVIVGMTVRASTYDVPITGYHQEEREEAEGRRAGIAWVPDYDWTGVPWDIKVFKDGQVPWIMVGSVLFIVLLANITSERPKTV